MHHLKRAAAVVAIVIPFTLALATPAFAHGDHHDTTQAPTATTPLVPGDSGGLVPHCCHCSCGTTTTTEATTTTTVPETTTTTMPTTTSTTEVTTTTQPATTTSTTRPVTTTTHVVTPPPPKPPTSQSTTTTIVELIPPMLAHTGGTPWGLVGIAVACVIAGIILARRKRPAYRGA